MKPIQAIEALWKPSSEPKDGMTRTQLEVQRDALRRALRRLDDIRPCCNTCANFDFVKTCKLHGEIPHEFFNTPDQCSDWRFEFTPF